MSDAFDRVRIGLVSVSDRASSGAYEDKGLPALRDWLARALRNPIEWRERLIPDEQGQISAALRELVDDEGCHLVLTTGGTGPALRDVTPEATLAVATKTMPGMGKGGMGLVFGAIDRRKEEAKDPNPRIALKVLNADFERHPQSFIALQREARKAQSLAHPNVVTVFDFDRDGDTVYMTMELLKDGPLEAMVREARGKGIKREIAMPIIRGIAEGLAYAHRKGIVHSDLKPGNVFIGEDGTPKILDFGIARAVPSSVTPEKTGCLRRRQSRGVHGSVRHR